MNESRSSESTSSGSTSSESPSSGSTSSESASSGSAPSESATSGSASPESARPESTPVEELRFPEAGEVSRYLQWTVLAGLALFGILAAVSLYTSIGRIIDVWVAPEFQPVFTAAFNLLVLLLVGAAISLLLRRLGRREG